MKHLTIIAGLLVLGGCATNPTVKVPTIVKVPVMVPCKVDDVAVPTLRFAPPYADVFEGVRDLLGDREVTAAYENELRTALKSCK